MRYVGLLLFVLLCVFAGCPAGPTPQDGNQQENTSDTGKDASTQDTKADTAKDDTTKDGTTKDDVTTDTTKDDTTQETTPDVAPDATKDDTTTDDTTPDPVKPDDSTEPGPDGDAEPTTDGGAEPTADAMADTTADTTADTMADATPETPGEGSGDIEPPDTAGLTCTQRSNAARDHVDKARQANLACTATTDCTSVTVATDCYGACVAAVNSAGKTKVDDAVKQANGWWCKDYRKDGCPYATPRCVNAAVVCDQQTCKTMDCTSRRSAASKRISDIRNANLSCTQDSDCTLVFTSTSCAGACQVSVNQQGATKLQAAITDINATTCANYRNDGCPYASPSCAAVKAVCKSGQCGTAPPN